MEEVAVVDVAGIDALVKTYGQCVGGKLSVRIVSKGLELKTSEL